MMLDKFTKRIEKYRIRRKVFVAGANPRSPEFVIATWFCTGLIIPGPGTWGTLGGMLLGIPLLILLGPIITMLLSFFLFAIGLWATKKIEARTKDHDQSFVVIDEVAAIFLTLAALPANPFGFLMAFLLFRLFDVWKPWPIRYIDRKVKGAWGVMLDDTLAALIAIATFWIGAAIYVATHLPTTMDY